MTNLQLDSLKDSVHFWWKKEGCFKSGQEETLPMFIIILLGMIHELDGSSLNLKDGTWYYRSGVRT